MSNMVETQHKILYSHPTDAEWGEIACAMRDTTSESMHAYQQIAAVERRDGVVNQMIEVCGSISNAGRQGQYGDWDAVSEQARAAIASMRKQQDALDKAMVNMEHIAATAAKVKEAGSRVVDTAPTTVKEWAAAKGLMLSWCIENEDDRANADAKIEIDAEWYAAMGNKRLDFTAPEGTPDGVHQVRHRAYVLKSEKRNDGYPPPFSAGDYGYKEGFGEGVIVTDGKFEPISTENAVLTAVARSYSKDPIAVRMGTVMFNYVFIEAFEWNDELQMLDVHMGS